MEKPRGTYITMEVESIVPDEDYHREISWHLPSSRELLHLEKKIILVVGLGTGITPTRSVGVIRT